MNDVTMNDVYRKLQFPNYRNSSTAVTISGEKGGKPAQFKLSFCDLVQAVELAGLSGLFVSDTGRGKSQLVSDIIWHHFGGYEQGGHGNWADGRPNFEITDLFERQYVDLSTGKYDSDSARQLNEDRIRRMIVVVDEINRAPKLKQNEFFDLAEGKYAFRGQRLQLGTDGYCVFFATANLNKLNGDFSGTSDLDRALLNRAHVTLDLDHKDWKPTAEDKILIRKSKENPRLDLPASQDISDLILVANKAIRADARTFNPYFQAVQFLIDEGLGYCDKDAYKEKGPVWPTKCAECDYSGKPLCSAIKSSSDRTTSAIPLLATAFSHLIRLKEGDDAHVDIIDAALQAFRLTTYHGNLNPIRAAEEYDNRKQLMMDQVIETLRPITKELGDVVASAVQGITETITYTHPTSRSQISAVAEKKLLKQLKDSKIVYHKSNLATELQEYLTSRGIGADWVATLINETIPKTKP